MSKDLIVLAENNVASQNGASVEPTKVCKGCGRTLPLSSFHLHNKSADGHMSECIECSRRRSKKAVKKDTKINPMEKFTARQLMDELYLRGYRGDLRYTQVHIITLGRI